MQLRPNTSQNHSESSYQTLSSAADVQTTIVFMSHAVDQLCGAVVAAVIVCADLMGISLVIGMLACGSFFLSVFIVLLEVSRTSMVVV